MSLVKKQVVKKNASRNVMAKASQKPQSELSRRRALFASMTRDDIREMCKVICDAISCSELSLSKILSGNPDWPVWVKFYQWMDADDEIRKMYAAAKRRQTEFTGDRLNEIADDESGEPLLDLKGKPIIDQHGNIIYVRSQVSIAHARLRIDTRKWLMSKLAPHTYGDRTTLAGDQDNPLIPKQAKHDLSKLSDAELLAYISLQKKVEAS